LQFSNISPHGPQLEPLLGTSAGHGTWYWSIQFQYPPKQTNTSPSEGSGPSPQVSGYEHATDDGSHGPCGLVAGHPEPADPDPNVHSCQIPPTLFPPHEKNVAALPLP
jgi:hypothetical protein